MSKLQQRQQWKFAAIRKAVSLWSIVAPNAAGKWLQDKMVTPYPWPKQSKTPAGATPITLPDNGVLWRAAPAEKSALLIHGWSGHRSQLGLITNALSKQGYAVHLLDPPGHGASPAQRTGMPRFAQAIVEAIDALGGPVDIAAGHSMGGSALLHLCSLPDRQIAKRMVSISAPANATGPLTRAAQAYGLTAKATEVYLTGIEDEFAIKREAFDILARADTASVPLLIISDEDDRQAPFDEAMTLKQTWPGAEMLASKGKGHNRTLASKDSVRAIIKFLD